MSVYESIIRGLNEAVEYEKGKLKAKTSTVSSDTPRDTENSKIKNNMKKSETC
ncbi:MAG: hypothetical protein NC253_07535 [Ruminococcus sp.]|nr:hypothetical protein [Ruminococcus sp.]MCM1381715.1 hypothetical protein [Muribaculaceae bacterium]